MNVVRWSAAAAVAVAAVGAIVTAPAAFAQTAAPAALPLPVVESAGYAGVAMISPGTQIRVFNTADPTKLDPARQITGIGTDHIIGLDFRPTDHKLYSVGLKGAIYVLDPQTGAATTVGKLTTALSGPTDGKGFDIDWTPDGKSLRIISATGQNIHQDFGTSAPAGKTVTDGKLSRQKIAAMAYGDDGRILDIDTTNAAVVLQSGTTGKITDFGPRKAFPPLYSTSNGIDIDGSDAFAVVNLNHDHTLYSVNQADGTVQKVGIFVDHVLDLALTR